MAQRRKYLVFRLYGPLASWGGIAVGEDRPSLGHPTKSAVLGLIAAALGIRRDAEEIHRNLARAYHYGVLVISAGNHLRDYHIALIEKGMAFQTRRDEVLAANWVGPKKPRPTDPMVTRRDYRPTPPIPWRSGRRVTRPSSHSRRCSMRCWLRTSCPISAASRVRSPCRLSPRFARPRTFARSFQPFRSKPTHSSTRYSGVRPSRGRIGMGCATMGGSMPNRFRRGSMMPS